MKDIKLKVRPYSLFYFFTGIWIWSAAIVFFKRRKNEGLEKFPYKNPVILSPNHQSAFMDALVTVLPMYKRKQLSFMVRQGVFDSTLGEFFLTRLLLFPAYRIRDGKENIHKNKGSFDHINNLLEKTRERVGNNMFFNWSICRNNCQMLTKEILITLNKFTKKNRIFMFQNEFAKQIKFSEFSLHIINTIINLCNTFETFIGRTIYF